MLINFVDATNDANHYTRRGLAMRILYVCLSVYLSICLSNECIVTKGRKICPYFTPHEWSAVTMRKSSINTNKKSTTRFPMSLWWSPYFNACRPKPLPKSGLKNAKRPFPSKIALRLKRKCRSGLFLTWRPRRRSKLRTSRGAERRDHRESSPHGRVESCPALRMTTIPLRSHC